MKLPILAAAAALLMSTAAQADNYNVLHTGTHWQTWELARNRLSQPMCGMSAHHRWGKNLTGSVMIKYTAETGLFVHILKSNWSFPADVRVPVTVTFDDRADNWTSNATTKTGVKDGSGMLELNFKPDAAAAFLEDFRTSDKMVISFDRGNEAPWTSHLIGSRQAVEVFSRCAMEIDPPTSTQPREAPTQPDAAPKRFGPPTPKEFRGA